MGRRLITLLLAVVAGFAMWAAFPDVGLWPVGLVATGLLWHVFSQGRPSAGWNALLGLVAGIAFFGPHVWWASVATALVPWIALTLLQAAFWAALGALWAWTLRIPWIRKTPWRQALAFAVLFTGIEQWRSAIPFGGFPWGRFAWSVAGATPGRAAWLGGSVLVTFLMALAASLVAVTARDAWRARRRPGLYLPPTYAPPKPVSAKKPGAFQRLLRPELDLLRDEESVVSLTTTAVSIASTSASTNSNANFGAATAGALTSSTAGVPEPSKLKKRARNILVPAHLQPQNTQTDFASSSPAPTPISPDFRLVIAATIALLLLAFPSWLPLPTDPAAATAGRESIEAFERALAENKRAGTLMQVVRSRLNWVDAGTATAQNGVLQVGIVQGNVENPGAGAAFNAELVYQSHRAGTDALAADEIFRQNQVQDFGGTSGAAESNGGANDGGESVGETDVVAIPIFQAERPGFDLIVWPENSAAFDPNRWPVIATTLNQTAESVGAPILIGTMEYPESGGRYNVSLLWDANQGSIGRYAKQIPAPFGEYIPFRTFARMLTDQVDRLPIDMIAADNPPVISWYVPGLGQEVTMGLGICFEVAYDHVFFDAVRQGAEFLVIPTNNASFGVTPQSTQQMQMTQMQAITTGRAAIQISTVGVSGVFTPDGQLVAVTDLWTQDQISALIPLRTSITPAVRLGMAPAYLFQALALALPLLGIVTGLKTRSAGRVAAAPNPYQPELVDAALR